MKRGWLPVAPCCQSFSFHVPSDFPYPITNQLQVHSNALDRIPYPKAPVLHRDRGLAAEKIVS